MAKCQADMPSGHAAIKFVLDSLGRRLAETSGYGRV